MMSLPIAGMRIVNLNWLLIKQVYFSPSTHLYFSPSISFQPGYYSTRDSHVVISREVLCLQVSILLHHFLHFFYPHN
jgi:hypothetical protein